ncbi:MAG: hypothetical protein ABI142_04430 [Bryocella sp.]
MTRTTILCSAAATLLCVGFAPAWAATTSVTAGSAFGGNPVYRTSLNFGDAAVMTEVSAATADAATEALPDAPDTLMASSSSAAAEPAAAYSAGDYHQTERMAKKYQRDIQPGERAQTLTARDKFIFGFHDMVAPFSFVEYLASASYSHITNGQPNYGVNSEAFGKRFGAAVLRDATEDLLSESLLAGAFHEDPRYYVMGSGHNFFKRVIYAVTRPIIGRTDSGHRTINAAVLIGYAGGAATTYAYYPAINQNFHDTAATYGGSLAGTAVGNVIAEFWTSVFRDFHLK